MNIYPISYSIPDENIVIDVSEKKHIWAEVIPGLQETYRFGPDDEEEYNQMYRESRFAYTLKKGGWDCLRHYEILANGCIPVFKELDSCPATTMINFPRELIKKANSELLPWKETDEYKEKYNRYVKELLEHTRKHLSTSHSANYFLRTLLKHKSVRSPKILFISGCDGVNYTRELLFIGLNRIIKGLSGECICFPHLDYMYNDYNKLGFKHLHGMGYNYSRKLEKTLDNEKNVLYNGDISKFIKERYFDFIVYCKIGPDEGYLGSIPSCMFWNEVSNSYKKNEIIFLYGEDSCHNMLINNVYSQHVRVHSQYGLCFIRELVM